MLRVPGSFLRTMKLPTFHAAALPGAVVRITEQAGDVFRRHRLVGGLLLALATGLVMYAGIQGTTPAMFFDIHGHVVYWPLNGILVGVMIMVPRSCWKWMLLGSTVSQLLSVIEEPWIGIMAACVANVVEPLIAASIIPPYRDLADWMKQPHLIIRFIGGGLLLAPGVPAGTYGLIHYVAFQESFLQYSANWACAESLGMALAVPLLIVLRSRESYDLFRPRALGRTVGLLGASGSLIWAIFRFSSSPVEFVVFPVLLLVVFELGFSGAVIAVNLLAIISCSATLHGTGPFQLIADDVNAYRIAVLQLFLTLAMLMSFPVSIVLMERQRFEIELQSAYLQMEHAFLKMESVATLDALTGLANRRHFDEAIEQEWRRSLREEKPLAVLLLDVDKFKGYNDFYGHVAGDECLRRVAMAICSIPSRSGDLTARYGGEEFVVLLPNTELHSASTVASRIRQAVAELEIPHEVSDFGLVTISIGCAAFVPNQFLSVEGLIKAADEALYTAKHQGRNRVVCWQPDSLDEAVVSSKDPASPAMDR